MQKITVFVPRTVLHLRLCNICLKSFHIFCHELIRPSNLCKATKDLKLKMLRRDILFNHEVYDEETTERRYLERINFNVDGEMQFREAFRISHVQCEYLLSKIGIYVQHKTKKNRAMSPKDRMLMTLHWLGSGAQYHGIAHMHGVGKSTVCRAIHRVIDAVVNHVMPNIICWPQNRAAIAEHFYLKGGFPNVCGCVDGTIINIDAPTTNEEAFVNRHGNHSLNVMMIKHKTIII